MFKYHRGELSMILSPKTARKTLAFFAVDYRETFVDHRCFPPASQVYRFKMYLQFYINDNGDKVYTVKKESPLGLATQSAHPARFSPDDKFSRQRVLLKKRFGLLPTQQPPRKY
ncbi:hypothetical protein L2E82_20156 [Cichorium intybus]|uniref:Uncharacterized protein n=1 Tax=Cichorium intybus TaxID=13427 RepID=A0ACB9DSJ4_CICIN|nr:hypothetical protein L2E82_20156 [Cichorium intybus]